MFTNPVFSSNENVIERLTSLSDHIEVLQIGIQAEKDSILIYDEIYKFTQPSARDTLYAIIKEEQSHLWQLSELKADIMKKRKPIWLRRIEAYGDTIADH
jgi:rubrerythrin